MKNLPRGRIFCPGANSSLSGQIIQNQPTTVNLHVRLNGVKTRSNIGVKLIGICPRCWHGDCTSTVLVVEGPFLLLVALSSHRDVNLCSVNDVTFMLTCYHRTSLSIFDGGCNDHPTTKEEGGKKHHRVVAKYFELFIHKCV